MDLDRVVQVAGVEEGAVPVTVADPAPGASGSATSTNGNTSVSSGGLGGPAVAGAATVPGGGVDQPLGHGKARRRSSTASLSSVSSVGRGGAGRHGGGGVGAATPQAQAVPTGPRRVRFTRYVDCVSVNPDAPIERRPMKGKPRRSLTVFKGLTGMVAPPEPETPEGPGAVEDSMFDSEAGLGMLFTTRAWAGAGPLRGNSLVDL